MLLLINTILLVSFSARAQFSDKFQYISERPAWAGVWFNTWDNVPDFSDYEGIVAGEAGRLRWRDMEPQKGVYDFSELKTKLERANENDYYFYCELWTGENSPGWIFDNGVPMVNNRYPYYLDENYKKLVTNFFDTLAAKVASYDPELIRRFAFIQPGFGSTGDRQLYKSTPTDSQFIISKDEYVDYMKEMTISITNAFWRHESTADFTFLWNIDDYDGSDPSELVGRPEGKQGEMLYGAWMKENYNCQLRKQQFTIAIGYMSPNEMDQDRVQRDNFFGNSGRWGGNPEFIRGEFNDFRWANTPLAQINQQINYYWTAISSVDRGLDGWEIQYPYINIDHKEAYAFSSRYSFYKKAETSPVAFIALRDALDYSDTKRFPESIYGEASRGNQQRINEILAEYSSYGARNDDNEAVMTMNQNTYLHEAKGYNDCLWNIISRNYQRFITQIEPNETSAGYWRVGLNEQGEGHHYGRFARGFDVEKGKNTMYFDVDDEFFEANRAEDGDQTLTIKVIYYASDEGSWELKYHAQDGTMKTALSVTNSGSGWQTAEVTVNDALLDNGDPIKGADLVLKNTGGTNCRFHMIELERDPDGKMIDVSDVSIENCPSSALALGVKHQLKATVLPSDATDNSVRWTSSNPGVATVDNSGLVTALAEGTTKIKVITNNGELVDSCTIAVKTDINILFIGNSFTFRHDLNLLVEEVFKEGSPNLNIYTERQVHGGQSLFQHTEYYFTQSFIEQSTLTDSDIEERIQIMEDFLLLDEAPPEFIHFWENVVGEPAREFPKNIIETAITRHEALLENNPGTKWDYVVLQSWRDEIDDLDDGYAKYAKILGNIANEQGAEVILYITAPDVQNQAPVTEPLMQEKVEQEIRTIVDLAREIDPYAVVHVPLAINLIQQDGTDLTFRYVNDFHPNQRTAYLTSNMFYGAFFGESTEGFNYDTVTETKTTAYGGELLDPDGGPATVVFEGDEKTCLQKMAFKAASLFNQLWKGTVSVTGVSIENEPVDGIPVGTTFQLNKKILPFYASDQRVSWSSSDPMIAEVDSTGLVSALDLGYVTITVTTNDGGFTDSYTLLVTAQAVQRPYLGIKQLIPGIVECEWYDEGGQGISFYDVDESRLTNFRYPDEVDIRWRSQASQNRFVGLTVEGEWLEYTVDVTPGDYDIMLYYFCQVDNSTEIEISLDGEKIATFTGMTNKGNLDIQDSVFVRGVSLAGGNDQILRLEFAVGGDVEVDALVFTPAADYVAVTGISINDCPADDLEIGETHQLSAGITPEDATDASVSWGSSNEAVATVDASGKVTALSEGNVMITVTSNDGGFSDNCDIIIIDSQTNSLNIEMESDLVKVYPNPVKDELYISFKKPQTETAIYIYNTLGALLYSKKVNTSSLAVDVTKYNKESMLLIQVVSNEFTSLHKVILTE